MTFRNTTFGQECDSNATAQKELEDVICHIEHIVYGLKEVAGRTEVHHPRFPALASKLVSELCKSVRIQLDFAFSWVCAVAAGVAVQAPVSAAGR